MNSNLWLGFLTEFGITSEDAVTVMDEADKYLQVNVSLLIYTRVPWLSVLFPYSPGLDGSTSPMLESQYVYILKLYSKRGMHILQSLLSLVGSREQYLVRQWNHEPGDCSCKNNDSWDMAVHWGTILPKSILLPDLSLQILSRTYAPSVAGVVQQMEYSHTTNHFTLVYHLTKMCTATTTEVRGQYNKCMFSTSPLFP